MKKLLFTLAAVAFSTTILAQKVKIKDNLVTVDKAPYLMIEKQMLGTDVSLFNFHTNELEISALHRSYNDHRYITASNPEGTVRWIQVTFVSINVTCEVAARTNKGLIKSLYLNKVYNSDGTFNEEAARRFANKYGSNFSKNMPGNGTTIIINN